MTKYIIVDVESDGPIIGIHSMVCFGAILLDKELETTFYGKVKPISTIYDDNSLAVSGFSRKEHESFDDPQKTMDQFRDWIFENCKSNPVLLSDNNGYDAAWINYYFLKYSTKGTNPFGWSSRRIGDMFAGFYNNLYYTWKKHRITRHSHNPVDDAKGNAEALLYLINQGFNLKL